MEKLKAAVENEERTNDGDAVGSVMLLFHQLLEQRVRRNLKDEKCCIQL